MIVLGLTGSIGMGKSEAGRMLARLGVPVFDSDAAVHRMMAPGGDAVAALGAVFPDVVADGGVDRQRLGARVFEDRAALERLEAIVHPRVYAAQRRFLAGVVSRRKALAALDIPLLFETGGERKVDYTAVVSAPPRVQRHRVLARPGMTEARLETVLARQLPDRLKRRRADFVLPAGQGKRPMYRVVVRMIADLSSGVGRVWPWPAEPERAGTVPP